MRQRDKHFVDSAIIEFSQRDPAADINEVALAAGKRCGWRGRNGHLMNDRNILKKALAKLANPDIQAALREAYVIAADLGIDEVIQWQARWIRGEIKAEQVVVTKNGVEKVTVTLPPSKEVLRDVARALLPQQPKQVKIDQRSLVARVNIGDDPPAIKPRAIEP